MDRDGIQKQVNARLDQDEEDKGSTPIHSDTSNYLASHYEVKGCPVKQLAEQSSQTIEVSKNPPTTVPQQFSEVAETKDRTIVHLIPQPSKNEVFPVSKDQRLLLPLENVQQECESESGTDTLSNISNQISQPIKNEAVLALQGWRLFPPLENVAQHCESENGMEYGEVQQARFSEQYPDEDYPYLSGTQLVVAMELSDIESESSTTDSN